MDPIDYLRALRRRMGLIAAIVIAALGAGWVSGSSAPDPAGAEGPVRAYEATVLVFSSNSLLYGPNRPDILGPLDTVAVLTTVGEVPRRVAEELGFEGDPRKLASGVKSSVSPSTGLLEITAIADTPDRARTVADTFASELFVYLDERHEETARREGAALRRQIARLQGEIAELEKEYAAASPSEQAVIQVDLDAKALQIGQISGQYSQLATLPSLSEQLEVIQPAVPEPILSTTGRFTAPRSRVSRMVLGGILGLIVGAAFALTLERLGTRVHTKEGAEAAFGLPVLAEVPLMARRARKGVVVARSPGSHAADAFRVLAAGVARTPPLEVNDPAGGNGHGPVTPPRVVLVTSPGPGEGKTTVVANLAAAFAEVGRRVLVISCDFHHPQVHRVFGVRQQRGLSDALRTKAAELPAVRVKSLPGSVEVVPSGTAPQRPGEVLSSEGMRRALEGARRRSDVVILDTPPLLTVSDVAHLLPEVDAVLVVARARRTTAALAERTREYLSRLGGPAVGVALNGATELVRPRRTRRYLTETGRSGGKEPAAGRSGTS